MFKSISQSCPPPRRKHRQCKGFTLAEVLITLGIIGVISALTISSLIEKYNEKVLVSQVKKTYSTILQAFELYKYQNETEDLSNLFVVGNTSKQSRDEFAKYFNNPKICNAGDYKCYPKYNIRKMQARYDENGNAIYNGITTQDTIILTDGSIISILQYAQCDRVIEGEPIYDDNGNVIGKENDTTVSGCAQLAFDVNGKKGPNTTGKDYFCMAVGKNGVTFYNSNNCGDLKSVLYTGKLNNNTKNY